VCGDGFTVGNETCADNVDENCNQCECVSGTVFDSERTYQVLVRRADNRLESKCVGLLTEPSAPGVVPFDNNLIAIFVVVPVGIGAAIFFGVYFGRKRKQQKRGHKDDKEHGRKADDVPLTNVTGDGKVTMNEFPHRVIG
jgi:hypothetical protein